MAPTTPFNPFAPSYLKKRRFTPYTQPSRPPVGYYDPNLDVQVGAANRGYGDILSDKATGDQRDTTDYLLGRGDLEQGRDRSLADLLTSEQGTQRSFGRASQDLSTREQRGGEDYQRSIDELTRQYRFLGDKQTQDARSAGVAGGSALEQAASKRTQNVAFDRAPIDTGFQRFGQDISTDRSRLTEDQQTALDAIKTARDRVGEDFTSNLGRLDLLGAPPSADNPLGGRSFQDRQTQADRAGRENTQFGVDVGAERLRQASQNGYAPSGPSNEFRDAKGNPYRIQIEGAFAVARRPDGSVLWRRKRGA